MKYSLNDGKIAFVTHVLTYEGKTRVCYSEEHKDIITNRLTTQKIVFKVESVDQPSPEVVSRCAGKIFNSYQEALDFIEGVEIPLTETEVLALAVAELYEMMSGGAV